MFNSIFLPVFYVITKQLFAELFYFLGDLHCETCTIIRGGLVGLVFGGLYPVFLALPVNGGLAAR